VLTSDVIVGVDQRLEMSPELIVAGVNAMLDRCMLSEAFYPLSWMLAQKLAS
jgi:hypothetical protein